MKAARKKIWGWYFFDWATQPYSTLMLTFVFGPFFATIASEVYMTSGLAEQAADAKAQSLWSLCLTIVGLIVGLAHPLWGVWQMSPDAGCLGLSGFPPFTSWDRCRFGGRNPTGRTCCGCFVHLGSAL